MTLPRLSPWQQQGYGCGMRNEAQYQRGDVVLVNLPLITDFSQAKLRPAVVIQNDVGNQYSPNLIVAAISSRLPRKPYPTTHVVRHDTPAAQSAGLDRDSVVLAQVILTIPKTSVVRILGHFDQATMTAIDTCIRVSLALDQ